MPDVDDHELLAQYSRGKSDEAFALLVQRYVNLVYSAALRQTGNPHAAQEIAQAVFIILAKKAGNLTRRVILSGWLYQTTRLTAGNYLRTERRRTRRDQEVYMQSHSNESDTNQAWQQLAPFLDDALGKLSEKDRNAIMLRYFKGENLNAVGQQLGTSADAAKMRVNRALEKLRKIFTRRGVTLSATIIAGAVSTNSVQAAPVGLAATIVVTAAKGSAVTASTLTLVKGALKLMAWTKAKTALVAGAAVILATCTTTVVVKTVAEGRLTPQEIAKQSQDAYAALSSYSSTGKVLSEVGDQTVTTIFSIKLQRPKLYRIDWTQTMGETSISQGVVWSSGNGDYFSMSAGEQDEDTSPEQKKDMQQALASATGVSGQAASTIPTVFFKHNWGDVLGIAASDRSNVKTKSDEKVGGVDCYVVSSFIDPTTLPGNRGTVGTTTTLWIGKQDHLIHQTRTSTEGTFVTMPQISDAQIKASLEKQNKPITPEAISAMRTKLEQFMKPAQEAMKSGNFVFTQTHENIVLNKEFSANDFQP